MLPTFVIGLREGLEAAAHRRHHRHVPRPAGPARRVAVDVDRRGRPRSRCAPAVAVVLRITEENLPQRQQEELETVVGLAAVAMVTLDGRLDAPSRPRA